VSENLEWTDIPEEDARRKLIIDRGTALYLDITFHRQAQSHRHDNCTYLTGVLNNTLCAAIAVDGTITRLDFSPLPSEDAARQLAEDWEREP
jgi:hypothetical protein